MIIDDIEPGRCYKMNDPNNSFNGIILTISHIQDRSVVRFIEPPFEYFGCGVTYFLNHYTLIE
jgi:hypothetical protein